MKSLKGIRLLVSVIYLVALYFIVSATESNCVSIGIATYIFVAVTIVYLFLLIVVRLADCYQSIKKDRRNGNSRRSQNKIINGYIVSQRKEKSNRRNIK